MAKITTEQFTQRLVKCGLVTNGELNELFSSLGTRAVPLDDIQQELLRREMITNYQLERIMGGHTTGFFYGDYKVLYIVGAGTFARVYRTLHRETGDVKAVKVLRQRYTTDSDTIERFQTEARTVMKLRHPNIVPIHDVNTEGHRLYMVMDFVEGQNLRDYVSIHGKLKILVALQIAKDIASGLDYAYNQNILHRDLKLSNILLSSKGRAMIVDFGLAAITESKKGEQVFNPRSIDYAALEKATKVSRDDKRSDIFFWGCMLYHMVTGQPAMEETRERAKRLSVSRFTDIKPVYELDPTIPHRVAVLLFKAMMLDPNERLQTPAALVKEADATIKAIEQGDVETFNADLAQVQIKEAASVEPDSLEGDSYTLLLVESHVGLQNMLRDALKKIGYKVLIYNNPRRALMRFSDLNSDGSRIADCVMFGCGEVGVDSLDAFNFFSENEDTCDVPAILITDETQKHFAAQAKLGPKRGHLEMPIKFRQMRRMLRKVLGSDKASGK